MRAAAYGGTARWARGCVWFPVAPNVFVGDGAGVRLKFTKDENGEMNGLTARMGVGDEYTALRIK